MHRCGFCLLALLSVGAPAWSQASDTHPIQRSAFSMYAGYSLFAPNIFKGAENNYSPESGWNAGIDVGIARNVGAAVDFSQYFSTYNYASPIKTAPFFVMAGPRVWAPVGSAAKLRPFAQFLAGGGFIQRGRTSSSFGLFASSTSLAWNAGGGLDIRAGKRLWVRGEAGYLHTDFTTSDSEIQQYTPSGKARIVIGILYQR
jgi:hypothetical protein